MPFPGSHKVVVQVMHDIRGIQKSRNDSYPRFLAIIRYYTQIPRLLQEELVSFSHSQHNLLAQQRSGQ